MTAAAATALRWWLAAHTARSRPAELAGAAGSMTD